MELRALINTQKAQGWKSQNALVFIRFLATQVEQNLLALAQ